LTHGIFISILIDVSLPILHRKRSAVPAAEPQLPAASPASLQYDLFSKFFGKPEDLSNTIELWDAFPKYVVSARMQAIQRGEDGRLPVYQQKFEYHPSPKGENPTYQCALTMKPARIQTAPDVWIDCYPSADEELVEEVIRKIFTDQQYGVHDRATGNSWVRFSLRMIFKELKARGKTRSISEIARSIEILKGTILEVQVKTGSSKKTAYSDPILLSVTSVSRADLEDDPAAMWCARLPALVTVAVDNLGYRQFNYGLLMNLSSPLARWLLKRLSHEYINADLMCPYQILFSTIERDSGHLRHSRLDRNIKTVKAALDELKAGGVLMTYSADERRDPSGRDILYRLIPTGNFVRDIKAANARRADAQKQIVASGETGQVRDEYLRKLERKKKFASHTPSR
jgi:hypothetical protein